MDSVKVDPIAITFTPSLELLRDIVTTAVEGGIGYWSAFTRYKWSSVTPASLEHILPWPEVVLIPDGDPDDTDAFPETTLTPEHIRKGLQLYLTPGTHNRGDEGEILKAIAESDASYIDSDGADVIVQLGMFGSIVYG